MKASAEKVIEYANKAGIAELKRGDQVVVLSRRSLEVGTTLDDQRLAVRAVIVGDEDAVTVPYKVCLRRAA